MNKVKNFFDDFTFHARVMPIMVVTMPIVIAAISKGILQGGWSENIGLILLSLVYFTMTSKIARNLGKSYEVTKKRYHKKLNQFDGLVLPLDASDETSDTDLQYISASNILRNYANSNRNKEQRVYQELKEYNFWRNLYGTKGIALVVYLLIIVREITLHGTIDIKNIFLNPYPDYVVLILMTLYAVTFVLFVNKQTVIIKAFDYAKSLIEVCERI